ncbi:hypothetical protein D3C83_21370 [compost metagenome]
MQSLAGLDQRGAARQQGPQALGTAVAGLERPQLGGFMFEEAGQQPGIHGIGLVAHVDRLPVVGQLAWVDQVHLVSMRQRRLHYRQVVVRGRFDGHAQGRTVAFQPGRNGGRLVLQGDEFISAPLTDHELVFGDVDAEGDFSYRFCHNDLRGS